jgi:hypothetical protein
MAIVLDDIFSLDATIRKVNSLEETINKLAIRTRRLDQYPFDTVAGELLAKTFALSRSAILLIQNGYPDEAFGLCRSLYESCIYLRYITREPAKRDERSHQFLQFGVNSKAFWFSMLNNNAKLSPQEQEDIRRYKVENGIPDDPRTITQPWSGGRQLIEKASRKHHPLDATDSTEQLRDKQRALGYVDTSSYVHCTQPGLNSYSHAWKETIRVGDSYNPSTNSSQKSCAVIQIHFAEIVGYCLFGMGITMSEQAPVSSNFSSE